MKIKHITHHHIDFSKYDYCVSQSIQYRYSASSSFLNAVSGKNWDVLVLGDYEAVMPIPFVKKMNIKIVIHPKLCQQLGVFSTEDSMKMNLAFHQYLMKHYFVAYYAYNQHNQLPAYFTRRQNFILEKNPYELVFQKYSPKRKRKLRLDEKVAEHSFWKLITLEEGQDFILKNMIGYRHKKDTKSYINVLESLTSKEKMYYYAFFYHGEIINLLAIYEAKDSVVLLGTYNIKERIKLNGSSKLVDFAISEWISHKNFDFEGSDVPSVEEFFRGFRPTLFHYPCIHLSKKEILKQFSLLKIFN